ncbi:MAG: hypothetical protein PHE33_04320 [Bacteroidales bacterium]|nr:hypothetical protein [Bacteroidales bacterium]
MENKKNDRNDRNDRKNERNSKRQDLHSNHHENEGNDKINKPVSSKKMIDKEEDKRKQTGKSSSADHEKNKSETR